MNTKNLNIANEKSIDSFTSQATDGRNIEGGGVASNPETIDPNLDPQDILGSSNENPNPDDQPNPYVHTSTG